MEHSDNRVVDFCEDPVRFYDNSLTKLLSRPTLEYQNLHIEGLRFRFNQLRDSVPMVKKYADDQDIHEINKVDDAVPLLFDHTFYKSYMPSLLHNNQFGKLTQWLNKLTAHDISKVDVSHCQSIDDWLMTLNKETPLAVIHTSGSSGTFSFLPWSKSHWTRFEGQAPVTYFQTFGVESELETLPLNIHAIYPHFRSGNSGYGQLNDATVNFICGSEERFHCAYPGRLSSDMLFLSARIQAAKAKGELDRLKINPALIERREEFIRIQQEMEQHTNTFLAEVSQKLRGQRVYIRAPSNMLCNMAEKGLAKGEKGLFASNSVVVTGGGGKGIRLPDNWTEMLKEYLGVNNVYAMYGMSEMLGTAPLCDHGRYHLMPWIVPFILDPETGKPSPRQGVSTGRFAFYDLMPNDRWGGFVTGDEVTIDWDSQCECGRTTYFLHKNIQRFSEKTGGDDKITCAATADTYKEAVNFLNEF